MKTERLRDICDVRIGRTPGRDKPAFWNGNHQWASIFDLKTKTIETTRERITDRAVAECRPSRVEPGTLLLSFKLSLGKVAIAGVPLYTNEAIAALPFRKPADSHPDYFYYLLQTIDWASYGRRAVKGNCLNKDILEAVEISYPALPAQKRIAALLEKADRLRRRHRYARQLSNTFLQSVFLEMFDDPRMNPMGWDKFLIDDVLAWSQYGTSQKSNAEQRGYPVLGMGNITNQGRIDLSSIGFVDLATDEFRKLKLESGDIIFNRTNSTELVGKTACWRLDIDAVVASYLVKLRLNPNVVPEFFAALLNSEYFKKLFQDRCKKAVGQSNISPTLLREFPIYVPPLPLQQKFADIVGRFERLRAQQREAERQAEHLFQTLLHRAFG